MTNTIHSHPFAIRRIKLKLRISSLCTTRKVELPDFLSEVGISLLGVIISVFALVWGLVSWLITESRTRNQSKRRFGYLIDTNTPVIGVQGISNKLEINFDGQPVKEPHLLGITLQNIGKVDIEKHHFDDDVPLTIKANSGSKFISISELNKNPDNLPLDYTLGHDSITIEPLLLNTGDSIRLVILTEGLSNPSISVRMVGVKKVEDIEEVRKRYTLLMQGVVITSRFIITLLAVTFMLFVALKNVAILEFLAIPDTPTIVIGTTFVLLLSVVVASIFLEFRDFLIRVFRILRK